MQENATARLDELLAYREWVVALARTLCGDPHRADDVAQDVWAMALDRPPQHAGALRAWFAQLVRRRVANVRREESRRARREENRRQPVAQQTPEQALARAETHESVVRAVLALHEPYRGAILLRYFEGLTAAEIAARTETPVETVRTRIKRGLTQLRERLDDEHGGDGRRWRSALAPLAWGGGVAMKTTTKIGIAAAIMLLLGGGAWLTLDASPAPPGTATNVVAAAQGAAPLVPAPDPPVDPASEAPAATPVTGSAAVHGAVWYVDPKGPAEGVSVTIGSGPDARTVSTDASGAFAATGLSTGLRGAVRADDRENAPAVRPFLPLRAHDDIDVGMLWLAPPAGVTVRVLDLAGAPLAGAVVEARRAPQILFVDSRMTATRQRSAIDAGVTRKTSGDGTARFDRLEPSTWRFVVRLAGHATVHLGPVTLASGAQRDDLVAHLGTGHHLSGHVRDASGKGVRGMRIWADGHWDRMGQPEAFVPTALTDESGAFEIDSLPPGDYTIGVAREGTTPSRWGGVRVPHAGSLEIEIGPRVVTGTVRSTSDGRPVPAADVRVFSPHVTAQGRTDGDGRYRLEIPLPVLIVGTPTASKAGFVAAPGPDPIPWDPRKVDPGLFFGQTTEVVHDLFLRPAARLTGRVLADGKGVPGATVQVMTRDAGNFNTTTDPSGAYAFDVVPAGDVIVAASAGARRSGLLDIGMHSRWLEGEKIPAAITIPSAGDVTHDLELPGADVVMVTGRVLDPEGRPSPGATVGVWGSATATDAQGAFRLEAPRGKVVYLMTSAAKCQNNVLRVDCPDGAEELSVTIQLEAPRRVRGRLIPPPGAALSGAWVQVAPGKNSMLAPRRPVAADGTFEVELTTAADTVHVRAGGDGLRSDVVKVPWDDAIRVPLKPVGVITGRVVLAESSSPAVGAHVLLDVPERRGWTWPDGRPSVDTTVAFTDADGRFTIRDVAAGAHTVEVVHDGTLPARASVTVPTGLPVSLRLTAMRTITGKVTLADGTPVVRASVGTRVHGDDARGWRTVSVAHTLEDGSYTMGYLPEGRYDVAVTEGMSYTGITRVVRADVQAGDTDVDFVVGRALEIRGRVVDADGAPVASATINAHPDGPQKFGSATSHGDGTFTVTGLEAGSYSLVVTPPVGLRFDAIGGTLRTHFVATRLGPVRLPRQEPLVVTLPAGLTIEGVAHDGSGAPLAGGWVRADPIRFDDETLPRPWASPPAVAVNDDGAFVLTGLPAGVYRLVAPQEQHPKDLRPLVGGERVLAGARGVRATLGTFLTIRGTVVDESGAGVAGAFARAVSADGRTRTARCEDDGTFEIRQVERGPYAVHAWATGRATGRAEDVEGGARGVRIVLTKGGDASGRLLDVNGEPKAAVSLQLRAEASPIPASVQTDADGRFTAKGLLPDTEYEVSYLGKRGNKMDFWPCGTLRAGDTDVDLRTAE